MNFPLIANVVVFVVLLLLLAQARHKQWSLAKKSAGWSGHGCRIWSGITGNLWLR